MAIISFLVLKGGVGKTSLALAVGSAFVKRGLKTLLIDADPQGSARDWSALGASDLPVMALDRPVIHKTVPDLAKVYDHIIIDGPPRNNDIAKSALLASDLVVIPVQPSALDLWAAQNTVETVKEVQGLYKPELKAYYAVNRRVPNTLLGKDFGEALAQTGLPALKSQICQRVAHASAMNQGLTVVETDPSSPAAKEIAALASEIIDLITTTKETTSL